MRVDLGAGVAQGPRELEVLLDAGPRRREVAAPHREAPEVAHGDGLARRRLELDREAQRVLVVPRGRQRVADGPVAQPQVRPPKCPLHCVGGQPGGPYHFFSFFTARACPAFTQADFDI